MSLLCFPSDTLLPTPTPASGYVSTFPWKCRHLPEEVRVPTNRPCGVGGQHGPFPTSVRPLGQHRPSRGSSATQRRAPPTWEPAGGSPDGRAPPQRPRWRRQVSVSLPSVRAAWLLPRRGRLGTGLRLVPRKTPRSPGGLRKPRASLSRSDRFCPLACTSGVGRWLAGWRVSEQV